VCLFIFGVMLEQVLCDIVDGIFGFILFLRECGQGLQDQRRNGLIEVGANGDGFQAVFGGLNSGGVTWLMVM